MNDPRTIREIDAEIDAQTEYEWDLKRAEVEDEHDHEDISNFHDGCRACRFLEA